MFVNSYAGGGVQSGRPASLQQYNDFLTKRASFLLGKKSQKQIRLAKKYMLQHL